MSLSSLADEEVANAQRRVSVTDYGAGIVAPRPLTMLEPIFERGPRPLADSPPGGAGGRLKTDVPEEPRL